MIQKDGKKCSVWGCGGSGEAELAGPNLRSVKGGESCNSGYRNRIEDGDVAGCGRGGAGVYRKSPKR